MLRVRAMLGAGCTWWFATACVPANVGYDEVRDLTAERLGKDVQWRQHEAKPSDEQTRKLLARPLTADTAVQLALLNNESLQAAFEKLGVARGELLQAWHLPNPAVSGALRFGSSERPEIDLDATLSLSDMLFTAWRKGVADAKLDAAKLEVAGAAIDLAFDVRAAFYGYQAAAQQLELRGAVLKGLRAAADMAERLHTAGNITDLELTAQRSLYEEARIAQASAEAELVERRETLNALMGLWGPPSEQWSSTRQLPEPVSVEPLVVNLEQRALEKSLDLALTRKRFEEAAKRANLTRMEGWMPEIRAGVTAERQEAWTVGPLAEIEVPLFYQGQGATAVALSEMRREQKLFADTAMQLRARSKAIASRLVTAEQAARYYLSTVLPLREQVVQQTQLQYNAMSVGVFQLLQAKRDQVAAAQAYVNVLLEYWSMRTKAEQLLAGRLPGASDGANAFAAREPVQTAGPAGH